MQFDRINVSDILVIVGLVTALVMSILYSMNELAMSVASGLLGYIGGTVKTAATKKGDDKP